MTLIVTFADRNFVFLVSDRRVTYPTLPPADTINKATLVCNRCVLAFTGLANIGPTAYDIRTDEWMLQKLVQHGPTTMEEACEALQKEATAAVPPIRLLPRKDKRLAFIAAGWVNYNGSPQPIPTFACVTNALTRKGWLPDPLDVFWIDASNLIGNTRFAIDTFGQPVPRSQWSQLVRRIHNYFGRGGNSYNWVVDQLTYFVRLGAANNKKIGAKLNVIMLPKPGAPHRFSRVAMLGAPNPHVVTWASFPYTGVQFCPNVVCGRQRVAGWRAPEVHFEAPVPDPDDPMPKGSR